MNALCIDNHLTVLENIKGMDQNDTQHGIPHVNNCFSDTILHLIPAIFLLLFSPLVVYGFRKSRNAPLLVKNPTTIRLVTCSLLITIVLLQTGHFIVKWMTNNQMEANGAKAPARLISLFILCVSLFLAYFLLLGSKKYGLVTSGVLFNYWLLLTVCGVPKFRATLETLFQQSENELEPDYFGCSLFLIYYLLVFVTFVVSCFADKPINQIITKNTCPEWSVSFINRITFWWFNKIARLGNKRALKFDDLWELSERDTSKHLVEKFKRIRVKQFDEYQRKKKQQKKIRITTKDGVEETELLQPNCSEKSNVEANTSAKQSDPPSLIWALFLTFKWPILGAFFFKLSYDLLQFAPPKLLDLLIEFMQDNNQNVWYGVGIAFSMFILNIVQSMFIHQYFHTMFRFGMNVRSILTSAVYMKALLLSNGARKKRTIGEIVNLMTVDIQRFQDMASWIMYFWSAPLQVSLSLFFLWKLLGLSVIAGLVCLLAFIPFNAKLSMCMRNLQQKQMLLKDERLKLLNEMLNGIKVLKLYAWEESIEKRIIAIREKELQILKKIAYLNAISSMSWASAPFLVAVSTFTTYVIMDPANNILNPRITFVAITYFNILRFPLAIFPMVGTQAVQTNVSNKRLKTFLAEEEIQSIPNDIGNTEAVISINDANFTWDIEGPLILKDINMTIKRGSLVAIVGRIGSGKSSLLSAILGEMYRQSGTISYAGTVSYVPQQAWIQNMTLKDNILFGKPLDVRQYDKTLDACALDTDLNSLPAGDETEIGEKGINLSGGQKQRISLARAAYSDSDIYFLDDPLSAVDSHVGKHIFEKLISNEKGMLQNKTRLLVTHGLAFLKHCDQIIVMKDGQISESGSYIELLKASGEFSEIIEEYLQTDDSEQNANDFREVLDEIEQIDPEKRAKLDRQISQKAQSKEQTPLSRHTSEDGTESERGDHSSVRLRRQQAADGPAMHHLQNGNVSPPATQKSETSAVAAASQAKKSKIIENEEVLTGKVKFSVYLSYLRAVTFTVCFLFILIYIASSVLGVVCNLWLAKFTDRAEEIQTGDSLTSETKENLAIYTALGIGQAITVALGSVVMSIGMIRAGRKLHQSMLSNILRNSMSWFDVTPLGRIMNRFGKDVQDVDNRIPITILNLVGYIIGAILTISIPIIIVPWNGPFFGCILIIYFYTLDVDNLDSEIPRSLMSFLRTLLASLETLCMICFATPQFVAVIIPLAVFYIFVLRYYVSTSRQLKRLESTTRSPIYSFFQESVQGASSIRAYNAVDRFLLESQRRVDCNIVTYFPSIVANRWLAVRLELVGNAIVFFSALSAVVFRDSEHVTAGLAGLSVSYALSVTQTLNWAVRMTSELETNIVAVERIKEYTDTKHNEASMDTEETVNIDVKWPDRGEILFENLALRYRPELDLVLKGVTAQIQSKEKIGIIGRTGAGKSSLTLALFRLVEPSAGRIVIDDLDIAKMGLRDLRSRLTIVPQDPVIFSGTIRDNLDPFSRHDSSELWSALQLTHLDDFVKSLPDKLEHVISEGGGNLSVGQRQLICLARALLRNPKVLILDEAAASVDIETDHLIQSTIREQFRDCTVLIIAHRLHSVIDSDRLLVFSEGRVVEFDSPHNLFAQPASLFRSLAIDAGISSLAEEKQKLN